MPVFENSIGTTYFISAPETCDDKIENGDETDVDCGGIICLKCNNTMVCKNASDCISNICKNNICIGKYQSLQIQPVQLISFQPLKHVTTKSKIKMKRMLTVEVLYV